RDRSAWHTFLHRLSWRRPKAADRGCAMLKILLIQGPNMSYLGRRQPELYGTTTAAELDRMLQQHAAQNGYQLEIFYTHVEGEAIARIYKGVDDGIDGLLINPAAWLYAGYPLRDTLRAMT